MITQYLELSKCAIIEPPNLLTLDLVIHEDQWSGTLVDDVRKRNELLELNNVDNYIMKNDWRKSAVAIVDPDGLPVAITSTRWYDCHPNALAAFIHSNSNSFAI